MRDFNSDMIQVLWVEDDPKVINSYPLKAENFDLELVPFSCWDEAKEALLSDFDRWSAIILDAKCKYHKESDDNAVVFLREALKDISVVCSEKGRVIPWYVLTAGDKTEVSDSINEERMKWDADWTKMENKTYYSKEVDNESLYCRIRDIASKSHRLQIFEMYHDAIEYLNSMQTNIGDIIIDIFEAMHYPNNHPNFNPILYYNQLRQILEYNFRAANNFCIIPNECFDKKGYPNLSQCCHYLSGNDATYAGVRYGLKDNNERIIPTHIELMMRMILDVGNINSHSVKLSDSEEMELKRYFNNNVYSSRYLIYSLALNACEISLWMKKYINTHPNVESNKKKCVRLAVSQEKNIDTKKVVEEGIVELHNGIYHIGNKYYLTEKTVNQIGCYNKKVKIIQFDKNTKFGIRDKYPLFACRVEVIND